MNVNRLTEVAPFPALSSLGSGHTYVSCPHPVLPCQHSNPSPKSDCPNKASSSNNETGGKPLWTSDLSSDPANRKPTLSAESSTPNGRDPVVHSIPQLHILHNHISPGYSLPWLLSPLLSISEIGTLEPRPHDTDSAISCVITYEICSLLPPCTSMLRSQLGCKDSSGPALSAIPIRDRLSQSPLPHPKGGGFSVHLNGAFVCAMLHDSPLTTSFKK